MSDQLKDNQSPTTSDSNTSLGHSCSELTGSTQAHDEPNIRRALISVTDKTGVVDFAKALQVQYGVEIISTGGTAKALIDGGVNVRSIEDFTGFPEMMDGRVKTLHPKVHGALLARRDLAAHMQEVAVQGIELIDLVVVNLYEFEKTVADPHVSFASAIEHIDIGGPSMLRSAAKNAKSVTVVSDPSDYHAVLRQMAEHNGATTAEFRRYLQAKVYATTAAYDTAIAQWLAAQQGERPASAEALTATNQTAGLETTDQDNHPAPQLPDTLQLNFVKKHELRYGENPHQSAAVYEPAKQMVQQNSASISSQQSPAGTSLAHELSLVSEFSLADAQQLQGKPLSYNNYLDADAAWNTVREFKEPACIILKHQNPCGSAVAQDVTAAYDRAFACDPKSAFGGIIACNREVPLELVQHFADQNKQFVEVLIAPSYTPEALERLSKRTNLRVLATGGVGSHAAYEIRSIDGGLLVQNVDEVLECPEEFEIPTHAKPSEQELDELLFAWRVCKAVKSNAILISKDHAGIGMGPGQPNRVDSARFALERAEEFCERTGAPAKNFVCASDAFFPFRDTVDLLAAHGVTAIIQPGGSKRDDESIAACNEHGIAMVFTHHRHFRH